MSNNRRNAIRRAAIIVSSLDRDAADAVLDRMSEEQSRAIRDELIELDQLPEQERKGAIDEFFVAQQATMELGGIATATAEPAASPMNESMVDLLKYDDTVIASAVMHERASVATALLGALPGKRAAGVLRLLQPALQSRVVSLLNAGVSPHARAVDAIANQICDQRSELHFDQQLREQHQDALQAIFDELSPEERRTMLNDISQENPLLAQRLKQTGSASPIRNLANDDCYC